MKEFEDWFKSEYKTYPLECDDGERAAFKAGQQCLPPEVREVMEAAKKWTDERCKGFIGICNIDLLLMDAIQKATEAGY